ncbi:MAG: pilus assembly protein PilM [Sedimentisphaerales bacterium]|nr:pilus assembly protein PilM [Sedimentisphaerales bacterium]
MLKLANKDVVGVDIGSYAVKAVHLSRSKGGWAVNAAAIVEIPGEGTDSPSRREMNTVRAIQNCMRIIPSKTKLIVCSVGGPEVAVRNFEFPMLPPEEMEKAVLLEAKQVCPFTTPDIVVDYKLIPNGTDRARGYFVAATNKLLKNKMRLSKKSRLSCTLMDVEALALLNCFKEVEKPQNDHGIAVLNIGSQHTTLAIEGNNGWPFVRNLNYSSSEIIRQIAEQNDITPEDVRRTLAGEEKDIPLSIDESLAEASIGLIGDINKTIRYYGAQQNAFRIERLLVCGGFAMFGGIVELLNEHLPLKFELWNPFEKMQCHSRILRSVLLKNILRKNGPAMTVAAGLAMRSIYDA